MLYHYSDIRTLHIEITERCNASCPQCNRNINGGEVNPYLKDSELTLTDIQKIVPITLLKQLNHIYFCGNFGDPIIAQDTLEVFKYFRENNKNISLSMNTNGSARNIEWWSELAKVLGKNGHVIFSIDGLEDTNHLYRRNTQWSKIIENVKAFIKAGGNAYWEFIVFKHNEHQVESAKFLAETMGFIDFRYKKTARFSSALSGYTKENVTYKDRKGNKINIGMPNNLSYRNTGLQDISDNIGSVDDITLPTSYEEIKDYINPEFFNTPLSSLYDDAQIDCKVKKEKSIYLSAEGIIQPCCWIASTMYSWYHMPKRTQIWKYINKIGLDKLNALNYSIEEIVSNEYFKNMISDSWEKPTCNQGKLAICARTCGKSLETFSKQYT